jgi:FtsP/CotA-like multicopper oxidase with cupredoxin domain
MRKKYLVLVAIVIVAVIGLWWFGFRESKNAFTSSPVVPDISRQIRAEAPQDVAGLPEAKPFDAEPIDFKDGEVFDMAITPVKKQINGQWIKMLGYNGMIPGPALRIPQGATITVRLTNGGDMPTTLHSHGVRMDNAFDGVPDMTQKAIQPGETFEYRLQFPDAGVFWYHPHVRTDYALESGLYGNYIVTPTDVAYWAPVNREVPIMLDDIALDKNGLLPFSEETVDHVLMGRFGTVMLTNGETNFQPEAKKGEVVRLYLTNAANTRVFNVAIPGVKMKLVGADLGRYAQETFADEVLIAPGERRVVDVLFDRAGTYKMMHKTPGKQYALETITVSDQSVETSYAAEFTDARTNAGVGDEMASLMNTFLVKAPDKKLRLDLSMNTVGQNMMNTSGHGSMGGGHMMNDGSMMNGADMGMGDDGDVIEWEDTMNVMNRQSNSNMLTWKLVDEVTGKFNSNVDDWRFAVGDKVKIRIFNDPKSAHPMQHPIHFHGQRFLVLSTNGIKNPNPVWQDTTLITKSDTIDILLEASNPGVWMAHCHILEHAESGMMIPFKVE